MSVAVRATHSCRSFSRRPCSAHRRRSRPDKEIFQRACDPARSFLKRPRPGPIMSACLSRQVRGSFRLAAGPCPVPSSSAAISIASGTCPIIASIKAAGKYQLTRPLPALSAAWLLANLHRYRRSSRRQSAHGRTCPYGRLPALTNKAILENGFGQMIHRHSNMERGKRSASFSGMPIRHSRISPQ